MVADTIYDERRNGKVGGCMKIKRVKLLKFKRFSDLTISEIPKTTKLVVLVGPNGCGKSSLFEAFNFWNKYWGYGSWHPNQEKYYAKAGLEQHMDAFLNGDVDLEFYDMSKPSPGGAKGKFYFRTAHRNDPDFTVERFERKGSPDEQVQFNTLMENDASVSQDYQRLIASSVSELYATENKKRTAEELTEELIGKLQRSLRALFGDLELESIVHPFDDGTFYFIKGDAKHFRYSNLSAGEKSAFDLILDMTIKGKYYSDAVYCIDEPEVHMHTQLQAALLSELYNLVPDNGQMWIATHSIGMLARAKEIELANPNTVCFLDFSGYDFDTQVYLRPSRIDRALTAKFLELTLGNYINFNQPDTFVFCEGDPNGISNNRFDSRVYERIFGSRHPSTQFISLGACTEVVDSANKTVSAIRQLYPNAKIIRVIDHDACTDDEIQQYRRSCPELRVLSVRNLEGYFLSDEIVSKYCNSIGKTASINDVLKIREAALAASVKRNNAPDDYKSAGGDFYVQVVRLFALARPGKTFHAFMLSTFSPLISPDTATYKSLEKDVFGA